MCVCERVCVRGGRSRCTNVESPRLVSLYYCLRTRTTDTDTHRPAAAGSPRTLLRCSCPKTPLAADAPERAEAQHRGSRSNRRRARAAKPMLCCASVGRLGPRRPRRLTTPSSMAWLRLQRTAESRLQNGDVHHHHHHQPAICVLGQEPRRPPRPPRWRAPRRLGRDALPTSYLPGGTQRNQKRRLPRIAASGLSTKPIASSLPLCCCSV
jgi:hypothetical protein